MKYLILSAFLLSSPLFSSTIKVFGPCQDEAWLSDETSQKFPHIGEYTLSVLKKYGEEFEGTERGLNSIRNTPVGKEALEIISRSEMRAYGWCFSVNGVVPEKLPSETSLKENDEVEWFFGHAFYQKGKWLTQCERTNVLKPKFICN